MGTRDLGAWGTAVLLGTATATFAGIVSRSFPAAAAVGGVVTLALGLWLTRTSRRRRAVAREPFPESWRDVLEGEVAFYRGLDDDARRRFEREVAWFLDEHDVHGPRGATIDDDLKVLAAASAVILVFGRPGFRYPRLRDVVVYPDAYGEDYEISPHGHILGQVGAQGPIVLSAKALREGFADAGDGHHVGLHEFAHVLDFGTGDADGVPTLMPWKTVGPWTELLRRETRRVKRRRSVLRRYAATNEAEFFAVATEVFFEQPRAMAREHPALYATLVEVFGQDPAR